MQAVDELEAEVEAQKTTMSEMEAEAAAECDRLREEHAEALREMQAAKEETDLKRETSRKLKEEIIDNDRLTVANLNRIKSLEAQVEQHRQALDEAEGENGELRAHLSKSQVEAEEVEALREMLQERENQIVTLSRRLSEALAGHDENLDVRRLSGGRARDSLLDRLGMGSMGSKALLASGA